jgi:hypothetical protein
MTRPNLTPAQDIAQTSAEYLWKVATCEDHAVAASDSPVYRAAEAGFLANIRLAYGLSEGEASAVRDLFSDLGPNDTARGTAGWGIASYAEYCAVTRVTLAGVESPFGLPGSCDRCGDDQDLHLWLDLRGDGEITGCDRDGQDTPAPQRTRTARLVTSLVPA